MGTRQLKASDGNRTYVETNDGAFTIGWVVKTQQGKWRAVSVSRGRPEIIALTDTKTEAIELVKGH